MIRRGPTHLQPIRLPLNRSLILPLYKLLANKKPGAVAEQPTHHEGSTKGKVGAAVGTQQPNPCHRNLLVALRALRDQLTRHSHTSLLFVKF
jgi:hypothetical protein